MSDRAAVLRPHVFGVGLGRNGGRQLGRHAHLHHRRQAMRPLGAALAQMIGRGGQRIGQRVVQIDLAIAIAVGGQLIERGRNELRHAEGAAPGADELVGRHGAVAQQPHRCVGVLFPQRLVLGAGARQPGIQHVGLADLAAVVGFDAEDGDQGGRVNLVLLADGGELRAIFGQHGAAVLHAFIVHRLGDVVPPRFAPLGLALGRGHRRG
ncbi:hypothetical protein D9M68_694080 [compost metagenome]